MQDDNYIKLEKVLMKIAFIPLSRLIDLTVSDYKILNRAAGSEIVTVAYNNGINLHQLCRNEMEIVNYHNAKKKDKIIRKVKALKAKLKSSPSHRRSIVYRALEPIPRNLASNTCVEDLVKSHIEEESEARNINNCPNEFSEILHPGSAIENIGNEYSNNSFSLSMNQLPNPFPTEVNLSDINSIDMNPPRVETNYEEAVVTRPELLTPEADDFGNADLEEIRSLGFDQNIMSSFRMDKQTNDQSAELLHHSSALHPRSSMHEGVAIPQILLDGVEFQSNAEVSISRHSMANSTQLSSRNYELLEKSGIALPECNRTPVALAASSFIIPPFSGIDHENSLSPTNDPQPDDNRSRLSTYSRRLLIFNNIQETLPVQVLPPNRRRRAQKVHNYNLDILNLVDDIMLLNNPSDIPESIMKKPHKNPRLFKTPSFIDVNLTFEFDLLKISKENPNLLSQSNLPIVNYLDDIGPSNYIDNDILERPQRLSVTLPNYDNIKLRPSETLPNNYKLQQRPTVSTPVDDNIAKNLSVNLVNDPVEGQNLLDERTALQKRGILMSHTYDVPDGIGRMAMNIPTAVTDISHTVQHFNVDNQQNSSRISDLNEVPIHQFEEELVPTENDNRQRLVPHINQLHSLSKGPKPHKNIIHNGQKYIQFADDHKFSVYFLELTFLFYEIQQLFVRNDVHTMDVDDVIQHVQNDKRTDQLIKIQLLNMCHNKLIDIIDDADRQIAFINIPFFGTNVE